MAFRKPLANLKTSAPLRSSDRRKLRQRAIDVFDLHDAVAADPDLGDLLVPEGIQTAKFNTHSDMPGVAYISPDGDTLWFSIGKGAEDLIPTVYTLWKHPALLPCLLTPPAVIPILDGGADLMLPGVFGIQCTQPPTTLTPNQLVSIAQFSHLTIGPPLAIGRLQLSGQDLIAALDISTSTDDTNTTSINVDIDQHPSAAVSLASTTANSSSTSININLNAIPAPQPLNPPTVSSSSTIPRTQTPIYSSTRPRTPNHKRKGKAVHIVHIYGDKLWEMGSKKEPPQPMSVGIGDRIADLDYDTPSGSDSEGEGATAIVESTELEESEIMTSNADETQTDAPPKEDESVGFTLTPQDISSILHTSLLQAIQTTLSALPPSAFPMSATTFYSSHILPARPFIISLPTTSTSSSSQPESSSSSSTTQPSMKVPITSLPTPLDIKHSTHKSLTPFLKLASKQNLLKLKDSPSSSSKSKSNTKNTDPLILLINPTHPSVESHIKYWTLADEEAKQGRKQDRERETKMRASSTVKEIKITDLYKPHQHSLPFFQQAHKDTSTLYNLSDLKSILNNYISEHQLVNPNRQQFINVSQDETLHAIVTPPRNKQGDAPATPDFLKREEVAQRLVDKMQPWYRLEIDGSEPITKKGAPKPVSIAVKMRNGNKACTLVTDFEQYNIDANDIAEDLRKRCASSTAVTPLPGKNAGQEVMVQGKQLRAVKELLQARGVPEKWIESNDLSAKKKK